MYRLLALASLPLSVSGSYSSYHLGRISNGIINQADGTTVESLKVTCSDDPNCVGFIYGLAGNDAGDWNTLTASNLQTTPMSGNFRFDTYIKCGQDFSMQKDYCGTDDAFCIPTDTCPETCTTTVSDAGNNLDFDVECPSGQQATCDETKIEKIKTQYDGTFSGTSIVNTRTNTPSNDNFWHGTTGAFDARKGTDYADEFTSITMQYFSMKFTTTQITTYSPGPDQDVDRFVNIFAFGATIDANRLAYVRYTNSKFEFCYILGTSLDSIRLESLNSDQSSHYCTEIISTGGDINNKQWIMTVLPDKISITSVADGSKGEIAVDLSDTHYGPYALPYLYTKSSGLIQNTPPDSYYVYFHQNADINLLQMYEFKFNDLAGAAALAPTEADAYTCMENPPIPPIHCVAAWSDCDKETCKETFTASTQPENGGQTCEQVYGTAEDAERGCTCPTVTAADITELAGKDAVVVERFNTLRGKAALQELDATTFAKVAEFDLRDLSNAAQKSAAFRSVASSTPKAMKMKIGTKEYTNAKVRAVASRTVAKVVAELDPVADKLKPDQPQVFVLPDDLPLNGDDYVESQVVTVLHNGLALSYTVDGPNKLGSSRRLLVSQADCDTVTATVTDGVVEVSQNIAGCYYDDVEDDVKLCPEGHTCDGVDKHPCAEGTFMAQEGATTADGCSNILANTEYAVGTGNTDKGDCATRTIDLQNCGCCTACSACPGIGEGLTSAEVMSAVETQCGGTC